MKDTGRIPTYELRHENQEVAFAIRSARDVIAIFGTDTDKPHRHDFYTVLWSHNHGGRHIVDYREYDMNPNDVFFVSPGQVHQVRHTPDADATVILFTCDFLEQNSISAEFIENLNLFSDVASTPPIHLNETSAGKMMSYVDQVRQVFTRDEPFKDDLIGAYLKLFLIECNAFAHAPVTDDTQTLQSGRMILKRFKEILDGRFAEWKKVGDYATALSITPDYLNEVVKTTVGKTAKEIIQQRVILEAKRLGLHTDLTTKEIAYRIGFDDPSHFSKFFRNVEGSSFTDFRNALNAELSR